MLGRRIPQNDLALTIIDEREVIELIINDPGHGGAAVSPDEGNIIKKRPTGLYAASYDDTSIRTEIGKKADAVEGSSLVANEEITKLEGIQTEATKNRSDEEMDERYVQQVEGKGLSDNNYTTEDKDKLTALENYDPSDLVQSFNQALQLKVEKEEDKSLVSNEEIAKLEGVAEKATKNRSDEEMDERYVRNEVLVNDIGVPGEVGFGVGVCPLKYDGMSELPGTRLRGHDNYGNYQYKDGSIMVWVPAFYYRYGSVDSARHADYGPNAADVLPFSAFPSVIAANIAGYPLHRAFYDDGLIQPGVMTDKFQCSNNDGIAPSIKGAAPMSTGGAHNPIGALNGSPSNNLAGTIDAAKTRGEDFFPTSPFIAGMLALLSLAHAEAAASTAACAWYDPAGITNYPKGCNNNALGDHADSEISYESTGHETYPNAALAGSGLPFAKTTHNGQACGIADLNGNFWEVNPGLTVLDGNYYILKTSARMASLTSGLATETDAWGTLGVAANYDLLGESFGTLGTDLGANRSIGSAEQVLSGSMDGLEWAAAGAGIPALEGTGGTNLFGNDRFYDNNPQHMCTASGGIWGSGSNAGGWARYCYNSRTSSSNSCSFRATLYLVRKSDSE